jgi:hypothetical protein
VKGFGREGERGIGGRNGVKRGEERDWRSERGGTAVWEEKGGLSASPNKKILRTDLPHRLPPVGRPMKCFLPRAYKQLILPWTAEVWGKSGRPTWYVAIHMPTVLKIRNADAIVWSLIVSVVKRYDIAHFM